MTNNSTLRTDRITLRQIPFNLQVGADAWGRPKPQPVFISLEIPHDIRRAAADDDVSLTIDYGKLYKKLNSGLDGARGFSGVGHLMITIPDVVAPVRPTKVEVALPKGSLRAEGGLSFTIEYEERKDEKWVMKQDFSIKGIRCACIVGVNPHEREEKQIVIVNLNFKWSILLDYGDLSSLYALKIKETISSNVSADIVVEVVKLVEGSSYHTVEALATAIAKVVTMKFEDQYELPGVWVEVEKPNAIAAIEAAGVRIFREKSFSARVTSGKSSNLERFRAEIPKTLIHLSDQHS